MEPGDKKIVSEDELELLTGADGLKLIAADPDYRGAVKNEVSWIELPNSGMSIMTKVDPVNMTGEKLGKKKGRYLLIFFKMKETDAIAISNLSWQVE